MANIRIADLPTATVVDNSVFLAIDSYGADGTSKVTPQDIITPTATSVAQNVVNSLITSAELTQLEQMLGINT